jgi:Interferon-induced transmembrane protein
MSYPLGPYEGSPGWQGQQPSWQGYPAQPSQPPPPGWHGPQPGWHGQPEPDNHLVWAILCTVLCCLPFGIVSLVYSNKVSGLWRQGRHAEAQAAADNAKKWAIIGAIVGGVIAVMIVILWVSLAVYVSNLPTTTTTTYPGF